MHYFEYLEKASKVIKFLDVLFDLLSQIYLDSLAADLFACQCNGRNRTQADLSQ